MRYLTLCCLNSSLLPSLTASREIPAHTLVEISPVLLFEKEEYQEHGRHTVLDHYTFVWRDGRMALALGLGSSILRTQQLNRSRITSHRFPVQPLQRP